MLDWMLKQILQMNKKVLMLVLEALNLVLEAMTDFKTSHSLMIYNNSKHVSLVQGNYSQ